MSRREKVVPDPAGSRSIHPERWEPAPVNQIEPVSQYSSYVLVLSSPPARLEAALESLAPFRDSTAMDQSVRRASRDETCPAALKPHQINSVSARGYGQTGMGGPGCKD